MKFFRTLRFRIAFINAVMYVPLIFALAAGNAYVMNAFRDRLVFSYSDNLNSHAERVGKDLRDIADNMRMFMLLENEFTAFCATQDSSQYATAVKDIRKKLSREFVIFSMIDTISLYSEKADRMLICSERPQYGMIYKLNEAPEPIAGPVNAYIAAGKENPSRNEWELTAGGRTLSRVIESDIGLISIQVNARDFLSPMESAGFGESGSFGAFLGGGMLITSSELGPEMSAELSEYLSSGGGGLLNHGRDKYYVLTRPVDGAQMTLYYMFPQSTVERSLSYFRVLAFAIGFFALLVLALNYFVIRIVLYSPINTLTEGVSRLSGGEPSIELKEKGSLEFVFLIRSVNAIIKELVGLKINVYESRIKSKDTELKLLQSQINPHFFSNALNITYNMAQLKDYKSTQKMILLLSEYFRFAVRSGENTSVADELKHCVNYLEIQKMRYPERLEYEIAGDPAVIFDVPCLTIQTFVENCMIHGFKSGAPLFVIKIYTGIEHGKYIIRVADNGVGFSEEQLGELNASPGETDGGHIGIWNTRRRLYLRYGDSAEVTFYNDGGACVQIAVDPEKEASDV